ncbi:MAG: hypothetical protein BAA01_12805 [Bacillus thermozeamaize]|uniref:Na/Pi cotransporter n=1 Tax=Bacillus thermozeamaize TaxID=230954 RepID=A0A1Y3PJA8_9BACI|nr:MAG: hypothetical protein BAA01_12805 [Bacillus thermozeamaize]
MYMREFLIPLTSGLAIFLFGMILMRNGLEQLAGARIRAGIAHFTQSPIKGFLTGTVATALLHSSSTVTVLAVGLTSAGLMSFSQSIGVILGANVGTTVTLEMLTFPLDRFALAILIAGAGFLVLPSAKARQIGWIAIGLSLLFIGLQIVQLVAEPLAGRPWFKHGLALASQHLAMSFLLGLFVTAVIQSSTAAIALLMSLMASGDIALAPGVAYVLGSNVGTCVTALIAALGSSDEAKKVALAHLVLNGLGALALFPLIPWFTEKLAGWGGSPAAQIAHTQVIFNMVCSLAVLPWARGFANGIHRIYDMMF